ncbi:MAG TPA: protein kinase, partial [Polyangiaceae bacterium]|nr:protein kinase [Polyangiaceae bacterium]
RPFVKILDFGISKFDSSTTGGMALTKEGAAMGTPYYMSPEQIRGVGNLDARADVYALGVILYECLAGKRPFESDVLTHLAVLIHAGDHMPLEQVRSDLPPGFADLVRHAMASDREKRMQTALELRQRLERYGTVSFLRTQASHPSGPPPAQITGVQARSLATSGIGVSMQTPVHTAKSQRGLLAAVLSVMALIVIGGGFLAFRGLSHAGSAAGAPSSASTEAPGGASAEPPKPVVTAPPVVPAPTGAPQTPAAIATDKAQPPAAAPAAPSAAHSAPAAVRSAPVPVAPPPARAGRSDERGLAKDNPFK